MILYIRAYGGDEDGSVYLQAFATFFQDHYMKRSLDRIYLMVKQAMIEAKQVGNLFWNIWLNLGAISLTWMCLYKGEKCLCNEFISPTEGKIEE